MNVDYTIRNIMSLPSWKIDGNISMGKCKVKFQEDDPSSSIINSPVSNGSNNWIALRYFINL